ncbi:hypothetical protein SADUNF_Sadunf09G0070400 [Salix dunnii]|uniref:ADP-ribosylation factor-like protein 8A n=1 Tax=Salix dunnii TaxID=1413687 RepID=A0A835JR00_9ROSI|nr:hypothetical protein SADUNF_Sadunf09G0070400 [Salix dunnii]
MGLWEAFLNWLRSLFFKQEMELSLIGLQNAGKTSLVNVIATGGYSEDMIPTVGFNMRKVTKGNVTIKLWDLGGQPRFRSMWERYCRAVSAIVYVVDAADNDNLSVSRSELHDLLSKPSLSGIPLLVLGNKIDKPVSLSKEDFMEQMGLKSITDREVCCYMISCKNSTNIDTVIDWLKWHPPWNVFGLGMPVLQSLTIYTLSNFKKHLLLHSLSEPSACEETKIRRGRDEWRVQWKADHKMPHSRYQNDLHFLLPFPWHVKERTTSTKIFTPLDQLELVYT